MNDKFAKLHKMQNCELSFNTSFFLAKNTQEQGVMAQNREEIQELESDSICDYGMSKRKYFIQEIRKTSLYGFRQIIIRQIYV